MKFFSISLFLLLLCYRLLGQERFPFEWKPNNIVDSLKTQDVDTISTLKWYCYDSSIEPLNEIDSLCKAQAFQYFEFYIFWIQKGKYFYKKFNSCFEFEPKKLDSISFLSYFIDNQKIIENEQLKQASSFEIKNGDTIFFTYDVDNYCILEIDIEIKGKKYLQEFYDYNFDPTFNRLNWEYNAQLQLFKLYSLMKNELSFINKR